MGDLMEEMSKAEYIAFLSSPARCAKLATVREDGRPHVVPVWFTLDGEHVIFTAGPTSVKVKNILRDGRVAICVDEDTPPFHYVLLEGRAAVLDSSVEAAHDWGAIIGGRYMGMERAEEFGLRAEGEWVMRMIPEKVIAYKNVV
jgi:PPOX class probable F420-dependent enzyme